MNDQLRVSALYVYPVKSLGGMQVNRAEVTDRGFRFDRRWMLVDASHRFMTQREFPSMAILQAMATGDELHISHKITGEEIKFPLLSSTNEEIHVTVWDDTCMARPVSAAADEWLSRMLRLRCRLVHMPDASHRRVDPRYATAGEITSFSDAFPFMLLGQSSLDDLNYRLREPLPMNRFRPNIVFAGGQPYEEDSLKHFSINGLDFFGVKPCARCAITTTSQESAHRGKEPLRTLATYRSMNNKIYFGQNLLHCGAGVVAAGDIITVKERGAPITFDRAG